MNKTAELPLSTYNVTLMILRCQLPHVFTVTLFVSPGVLCKRTNIRGIVYTRGFPYSSLFLRQRGRDIEIDF